MRTGSGFLIAGLALLGAGVLSMPPAEHTPSEYTQVLDPQGASVLDMGTVRVDRIVLDAVREATFRRKNWRNSNMNQPLTTDINDGVMTLRSDTPYWHDASLTLPITIHTLRGNEFSVSALRPVESLLLEGTDVEWHKGNAKTLDIRLRRVPGTGSSCTRTREPHFLFNYGSVERLSIHAESGTVKLEYIDQVGDIELHAGPSVRIQARHTDLARIRIVPLDIADMDISLPPPPSSCRDTAATDYDGP